MQRSAGYGAEDSCLKNHTNNEVSSTTPDYDVEKTAINPSDPTAHDVALNTQCPSDQGGKGLYDQNAEPDTDTSTLTDEQDDFPEGGLRGYCVVIGAFCGLFSVFGIINSTGILLEYFSTHQLKDYTSSQIGWIFGLSLFLTFFCGAPIGPIFDAYGPRLLMLCGSVLLVASMFLLGLCTQYWHFFMVYSVLNGLGGAFINTPCISSIGHFFLLRRGNATGIAMTSGSIGGIIFPLMLQKLFPMLGFAWATRIMGFILAGLLGLANILVRGRLPGKPMASFMSVAPDLTVFKDPPFAFVSLGIFLMEWGIFVPLTYLTSYSTSHGHSSSFGFQIIAVLNGGSFFGRFFAGLAADMIGRVNTLILSIVLCIITCFALWLPAGDSTAMTVVFAVIFGFVSGSNLSLSPVCVGQMCKTEHYGRYYSTCWMFVAFGTLTALPIGGQILIANGGKYIGLIIFAGLSYTAAAACLIAARVLKVGWKIKMIY